MYKRFNNGLHKVIFIFLLAILTSSVIVLLFASNNFINKETIIFDCNGQSKSLIKTKLGEFYRDIVFGIHLNKKGEGFVNINGILSVFNKKLIISRKIFIKYEMDAEGEFFVTVVSDEKNLTNNASINSIPYFRKDHFLLKKMTEDNYIIYDSNDYPFLSCKKKDNHG